MSVTIGRTAWTDDDGTGTTGTVINNAEKTALYNQIDTALALVLPLAGGTLVGDLKFTDASFDIGKSGATRPRDGFFSRNLVVGGTLAVTGATTLTGAVTHTSAEIDGSVALISPTTGQTVTMAAGTQRQIINPAGTLAALTVKLPPSPVNGQIAGFSSNTAITALTVQDSTGGGAVLNPPTTLAAGGAYRWVSFSGLWWVC